MSTDADHPRPSFRFRDKFSNYKERIKDKIKDKIIKHNLTIYAHQNYTPVGDDDQYGHSSRHGFRQHMHHMKDVLKNKTHYYEIKDKIKQKIDDKLDLHDNKTYPKGFYDSLFSPESENDVYLQTALICLWAIALLCIIPTLIIIFLPSKKTTKSARSTNMIFFHVFLCELFYLSYVLLAMINVAKDFRLGSTLCGIANYGMYVTIPVMQFALLFLSLQRLTRHFNVTMTWARIFSKPYLIQVILFAIWIILIAIIATLMFIKKQFSVDFVKDKISHLAPPIFGDIADKLASRRHHCSVDGRLSSVFKVVIIVLFIVLIVKPIIISLSFNLLTPCCCRRNRKDLEKQGDRRTTTLVTIFLLLNLFFSFPFYFVSMFKSILSNIDSTKDLFDLVLKICFILRITNIIFECLAFYIFERKSWSCMSKLCYYATCKKFSRLKEDSDDDGYYSKDRTIRDLIIRGFASTADEPDDDDNTKKIVKQKKPVKKKPKQEKRESKIESDSDDDKAAVSVKLINDKRTRIKRAETPVDDDDPEPVTDQQPSSKQKQINHNNDTSKRQHDKEQSSPDEEPDNDKDERKRHKIKAKSKDTANEIDVKHITETKGKISAGEHHDDEDEYQTTVTRKHKSRTRIEKEKDKHDSKSTRHNVEKRTAKGRSSSRNVSHDSTVQRNKQSVATDSSQQRQPRKQSISSEEVEIDKTSNTSRTSSKNASKVSPSSKPVQKAKHKTHSSSSKRKRNRTHHAKELRSADQTELSTSKTKDSIPAGSDHKTKATHYKHTYSNTPRKDYAMKMIEISDEV